MEDPIDLIERYFENSLNEEELSDFQQRLETDESFAKAFQIEQDLMEGIEFMGNQNLRAELKGIYKEEIEAQRPAKGKAKPKSISRRRWLLVAATIAILIVAPLWLNRSTPERLYAEYFNPDFNFVKKGDGDELIAKVEAALKNGDYEAALPLLEELLEIDPGNSRYLLSKGIALVETEKYAEGIAVFVSLRSYNPNYKNEVLWYHGLALLKQGRLTKSYIVLKQISERSARYKEAQELARKIR